MWLIYNTHQLLYLLLIIFFYLLLQDEDFLDLQSKQLFIFTAVLQKIYDQEKKNSPQGRFTKTFGDILDFVKDLNNGIQ